MIFSSPALLLNVILKFTTQLLCRIKLCRLLANLSTKSMICNSIKTIKSETLVQLVLSAATIMTIHLSTLAVMMAATYFPCKNMVSISAEIVRPTNKLFVLRNNHPLDRLADEFGLI